MAGTWKKGQKVGRLVILQPGAGNRASRAGSSGRRVVYEREVSLLRKLVPTLPGRHYGEQFADVFIAIAAARERRLVCLVERTAAPPKVAAGDVPRWWTGQFTVWETNIGRTLFRMKHEKAILAHRRVGVTRAAAPSAYPTVAFLFPDGRIAPSRDLRVVGGGAPLDTRKYEERAREAQMAKPTEPSGVWRALVSDTCWLTYDEISEVPWNKDGYPLVQGTINLRYHYDTQGQNAVDNRWVWDDLFKRNKTPFIPPTTTISIGEGILGAPVAEVLGTLSHEAGHGYMRMYQNYLCDLWRRESRQGDYSDWLQNKRVRKKHGLDMHADLVEGWSRNGEGSLEANLLHPLPRMRKFELLMFYGTPRPVTPAPTGSTSPKTLLAPLRGVAAKATSTVKPSRSAAADELGAMATDLRKAYEAYAAYPAKDRKDRKDQLDWSRARIVEQAVEIATAAGKKRWENVSRGLDRKLKSPGMPQSERALLEQIKARAK